MFKKIITVVAVSIASVTLLSSCGGERENDVNFSIGNSIELAQAALVKDQILPGVVGFKDSATNFYTSANTFCNSPTATKLSSLQDNWKRLSISWQEIELFNFGPLNDDIFSPKIEFINSYRNRGIDYTGTVRAFIKRELAKTSAVNFANLNFNQGGLLALEILSFSTSDDSASTDKAAVLADFNNARKCYLLKGYAKQVKNDAVYIHNGWVNEHLATGKPFKDIYLSGILPDDSSSLTTLIIAVQEHLDYIKKRNVLSRTAKLSQISYDNALTNINAVEKLLEGTTTNSFFTHMLAAGHGKAVEAIRANIASVKQALLAKDQASYEAAIGVLDGNFKREIPAALAVSLGLNFSDGD